MRAFRFASIVGSCDASGLISIALTVIFMLDSDVLRSETVVVIVLLMAKALVLLVETSVMYQLAIAAPINNKIVTNVASVK